MIEVNSDNLWHELDKLAKQSKSKQAAVAYITDDSYIAFDNGDELIVDASDEAIASGKSSAKVLETAFKKGTRIYSCDNLHAKTIIFDQNVYIGSANISLNSVKNLIELGIISDHPNILAGAVKFIEQLKLTSRQVDEAFIELILNIPTAQKGNHHKRSKMVHIEKPRFWMVSISNDYNYPGDEEAVESDNKNIKVTNSEIPCWFWHRPGTKFFEHAKIGDSVVIIERERRAQEEPDFAYRHFTIKNITNDDNAQTKAYHYAFSDKYRIAWSIFKTLTSRAEISNLGTGLNTTRELTERQSNLLFELWHA